MQDGQKKAVKPRGKSARRQKRGRRTPRIIGGRFRHRKLLYSGDARVRPMKERVREAAVQPDRPGRRRQAVRSTTGSAGTGALGTGAALQPQATSRLRSSSGIFPRPRCATERRVARRRTALCTIMRGRLCCSGHAHHRNCLTDPLAGLRLAAVGIVCRASRRSSGGADSIAIGPPRRRKAFSSSKPTAASTSSTASRSSVSEWDHPANIRRRVIGVLKCA